MAKRRKDMPATTLRVTRAGYVPDSLYDQEIHARFAIGSIVEADLHQEKSNDQLKLYWGFLAYVVQATGRFGTARSLSNALLMEGGYVENFVELMNGSIHATPMSIADMDKRTFDEFCHNAFATIYELFEIDVDTYKEHLRGRNF